MMRAIGPWVRVLLGVAVLGLLARTLGAEPFVRGLGMIDGPALLAAVGIGMATTLASAGRWVVVARGMGLRLGLPRAVADYYRALLLNAVLPAGVLGDVHRAFEHGRRVHVEEPPGSAGRAVRAVVLERAAGQAVLIAAAVAVLILRPELLTAAARALPSAEAAAVASALLMAAIGASTVWLLRSAGGRRRLHRARAWAAEARSAVLTRRRWPAVALLSAAGLAGHLSLFVVATRVAGTDAPVVVLLPPLLLALVAMSVPVGVGGWGPRESAAALGFAAVGLGAGTGLSAAVVYGVLALVAALPGVFALLPLGGAERRRTGDRPQDPAVTEAPEPERRSPVGALPKNGRAAAGRLR
ncbi:lysylphosphatidylglycerol synthase transmembrane domain-containing protein [Streptomonospora alba]|uniref:lysylphosphatidylglycerol synthase transmembrane domain-containing protein n=1 Tax=Streptomonospora alba TaxID=183763 RepID=UPI00069B8B49|nr:lysylphosphatidylglycerol synthase transmembrane domain-containing protein [Streptomonospora alba]